MFSKACEYAFRTTTLIALASERGERLNLNEITERTSSPKAFTAKVLQQLANAGILESHRGPNGGFELPLASAKKMPLSRIAEAFAEWPLSDRCAMGLESCSHKMPCPLHDRFGPIRDHLRTMLENTTVHSLTQGLQRGKTHLKI